ncbi:glycoside hydrolase superfamily [Chytriomyces sp. MP71]|nr:glycoside hydrolase superfamily [Chytriomyces sp. MP71]
MNLFKSQKTDAEPNAPQNNKRRYLLLIVAAIIFIAAIVGISVGVVVSKRNSDNVASSAVAASATGTATSSSNGTSLGGNSTTAPSANKHKFWGYYGANAIENGVDIRDGLNSRPLKDPQRGISYYCDLGYYDYINLAFLNVFGSVNGLPYYEMRFAMINGYDGNLVYVYKGDGKPNGDNVTMTNYLQFGQEIKHCQAKGVKVIVSLGGDKVSNYFFNNGDGALYAQTFYNAFLEGKDPNTPRPFGQDVILDGIELDIEKRPNAWEDPNPSKWTDEMVSLVENLRRLSPKTTLAAVPQCVTRLNGTDENCGAAIAKLQGVLDYIIVQYYNNPPCSYPYGFNFDTWAKNFAGQIVVGLAGDHTSAIAGGFLDEGPLQAVYDMVKDHKQFAGFSVYDVSSSNPPAFRWTVETYPNPKPTNYSGSLYDVLNGKIVGSGFPPQGPVWQDGVNTTYRCAGTWIWAETHCDLPDCYALMQKPGADPDAVCNNGNPLGKLECNQMISKTCNAH